MLSFTLENDIKRLRILCLLSKQSEDFGKYHEINEIFSRIAREWWLGNEIVVNSESVLSFWNGEITGYISVWNNDSSLNSKKRTNFITYIINKRQTKTKNITDNRMNYLLVKYIRFLMEILKRVNDVQSK